VVFVQCRISRWEGALFFGYWLAYTAYILLAASHHEALDEYRSAMISFVIPLTIVTTLVIALHGMQRRRAARSG
jgi:cation:H+ antiporter